MDLLKCQIDDVNNVILHEMGMHKACTKRLLKFYSNFIQIKAGIKEVYVSLGGYCQACPKRPLRKAPFDCIALRSTWYNSQFRN